MARRIVLLLFLSFYFSSSMAATHHRARRQIRRVLYHAMPSTDVSIVSWDASRGDAYPRFREAKKIAVDLHFRRTIEIQLKPQAQDFHFTDFHRYWETHQVRYSPVTRAPPARA